MDIKFKKCTEKGNFTVVVHVLLVFLLYSNANEFFELRIKWHSDNKRRLSDKGSMSNSHYYFTWISGPHTN